MSPKSFRILRFSNERIAILIFGNSQLSNLGQSVFVCLQGAQRKCLLFFIILIRQAQPDFATRRTSIGIERGDKKRGGHFRISRRQ